MGIEVESFTLKPSLRDDFEASSLIISHAGKTKPKIKTKNKKQKTKKKKKKKKKKKNKIS